MGAALEDALRAVAGATDLDQLKAVRIAHAGDRSPPWPSPTGRSQRFPRLLSGHVRKFVGGSDPGCGVAEVEAAGGVEGVFGSAGRESGWQDGIFVAVLAGQVDRESPAGG